MKRALAVAVAVACAASSSVAVGDVVLLSGSGRALPRTTSASRDAPVFEYAYGPRAQASLGGEIAVLTLRGESSVVRIGGWALVALENSDLGRVFPPSQLWRAQIGVTTAIELPRLARRIFGPGSDLELSLGVGHESDHATNGTNLPTPGVYDVPFGGGGDFFVLDAAWKIPVGRRVSFLFRFDDRVYFNELPLVVGARAISDDVASALREAWTNVASTEIVARWTATRWLAPTLALDAEHLFAHDPFVADGAFVRVLAGAGLLGRTAELMPFVSFDAGNGKGMLVDRRELRLSVGVRYAPF